MKKIKKILIPLLAFVLCFSLAACNDDKPNDNGIITAEKTDPNETLPSVTEGTTISIQEVSQEEFTSTLVEIGISEDFATDIVTCANENEIPVTDLYVIGSSVGTIVSYVEQSMNQPEVTLSLEGSITEEDLTVSIQLLLQISIDGEKYGSFVYDLIEVLKEKAIQYGYDEQFVAFINELNLTKEELVTAFNVLAKEINNATSLAGKQVMQNIEYIMSRTQVTVTEAYLTVLSIIDYIEQSILTEEEIDILFNVAKKVYKMFDSEITDETLDLAFNALKEVEELSNTLLINILKNLDSEFINAIKALENELIETSEESCEKVVFILKRVAKIYNENVETVNKIAEKLDTTFTALCGEDTVYSNYVKAITSVLSLVVDVVSSDNFNAEVIFNLSNENAVDSVIKLAKAAQEGFANLTDAEIDNIVDCVFYNLTDIDENTMLQLKENVTTLLKSTVKFINNIDFNALNQEELTTIIKSLNEEAPSEEKLYEYAVAIAKQVKKSILANNNAAVLEDIVECLTDETIAGILQFDEYTIQMINSIPELVTMLQTISSYPSAYADASDVQKLTVLSMFVGLM